MILTNWVNGRQREKQTKRRQTKEKTNEKQPNEYGREKDRVLEKERHGGN